MSTIVTRAGKGSALTHNEVDANFVNLNTDKIEAAQTVTLTNKTISGSNNTLSNIGNSSLTNSSVTIGSTSVSLGSTATTVAGLTLSSPTVSGNAVISSNSSSDALRITQNGAGNALVVEDSTNPDSTPFVVDADGRLVIGATTSQSASYRLQSVGTNGGDLLTQRWAGSITGGSFIRMQKSRGATVGTNAIVASGDTIATLSFDGDDGTQFVQAALITAAVDGTPGTNDMPGRLVFSTTSDGASGPTERMRIDSAGNINIATVGARIRGDFSNATVANRVMFQTSTVNGNTLVSAIPNGTGNTSGFNAELSSSDPANSSAASFGINSTDVRINSLARGTGSYLPMTFYTGGSERMRIDTSGNVGIGTSSPFSAAGFGALTINGTSGGLTSYYVNGTETGRAQVISGAFSLSAVGASNVMQFNVNGSERMRVDTSGNVGIGTSSPTQALSIYRNSGTAGGIEMSGNANTLGTTSFFVGQGGDSSAFIYQRANAPLYIGTNNLTKVTIDASGSLLVTNPAGLGYGTGSGGTVTQATSKSTAVTLNKPTGKITMNNAALAAGASVSFLVNNSLVGVDDTVILSFGAGVSGVSVNYSLASEMTSGGFYIGIRNVSASSRSEAVIINFAVIKGATA